MPQTHHGMATWDMRACASQPSPPPCPPSHNCEGKGRGTAQAGSLVRAAAGSRAVSSGTVVHISVVWHLRGVRRSRLVARACAPPPRASRRGVNGHTAVWAASKAVPLFLIRVIYFSNCQYHDHQPSNTNCQHHPCKAYVTACQKNIDVFWPSERVEVRDWRGLLRGGTGTQLHPTAMTLLGMPSTATGRAKGCRVSA